ncbi:MAG: PAS domain S-box protein [Pirellulaceae bacterium]
MTSNAPILSVEQQLREMNEALLVSSIRQQELAEQAQEAEAEMRTSELRYRALFESAPMAVFACDAQGVIQHYNAQAVELWGREPECGVEKHCGSVKLWLPDGTFLPHDQSPLVQVLRTGVGVYNVEVFIERPDGSRLPVLVNFAALQDATGEVSGAITSFIDIADRKQAETSLRASEERYRGLFNSMDEGYCIIEVIFDQCEQPVDYRFLEVNPAFEKQSGMHGAPGKRMREFVSEIEEPWLANYGQVVRTGEPIRFAHEFKALNRWFDVYAFKVGGWESRKVAVLFTDITQQRSAAEVLHHSEVRYRRLFESAEDGILILDGRSGAVTDANPFMATILGYSQAALLGKELWEIGLLQDADISRRMVQELQQEGYVRYEHLPLETAAGRRVEVEVIATAYREDDRPAIQCNIRDITQRILLEQKTREQAVALADLHRRKDEFLAMLSHELRNPLAPILNSVQLLRMQRDRTPLQAEAHAIIDRQVAQLARLVDDLLEVSRISTGRIHLQAERLDLRGIVERAIETTQSQVGRKGQSLAKSLPYEPVWVYGDSLRLEQVVVNLLNNASKYTDRGEHLWVGLEVEGGQEPGASGQGPGASRDPGSALPPVAALLVRDNGVGIDPKLLPHIFDLFTQADKSLDRSQGGLGIGLALVKSLVALHGGTVEARSTVGEGSEFLVRLPLLLSPQLDLAPRDDDETHAGRGLRVLVVDDNVDAANGVALLLRAFGHEARVAHDGASAMQAALEYVPAAVLLDIGLPVANGFQVAQWIRQEPALKNVVLVALTGYGQESDRQRSHEAGFDHHLVKPVDFAKVRSILSAVAENAP